MVILRRVARGVAILAVALAAGHLVQTINNEEQALATRSDRPTQVVPVSAGPGQEPAPAIVAASPGATATATEPPAAQPTPAPAPVAAALTTPTPALPATPAPLAELASVAPEVKLPDLAGPEKPLFYTPELPSPAPAAVAPTLPLPKDQPAAADACAVTLDLMAEPQALLGVTLVAPCHPDARVVLRHAGLAVTGRTNANGSLFTSLPALAADGEVSVLLPDQTSARAALPMPEVASLRRFAVQWMGEDAFRIQAMENGAAFGTPGHISAENTGSGALRLLGDATVDRPLLAQVYTYPADPKVRTEVIVEVEVTPATCDREVLGETILSAGGTASITDLTVATPPCDAVGDILVLKNLAPDLKIAGN